MSEVRRAPASTCLPFANHLTGPDASRFALVLREYFACGSAVKVDAESDEQAAHPSRSWSEGR